jgi:hypothetical protein
MTALSRATPDEPPWNGSTNISAFGSPFDPLVDTLACLVDSPFEPRPRPALAGRASARSAGPVASVVVSVVDFVVLLAVTAPLSSVPSRGRHLRRGPDSIGASASLGDRVRCAPRQASATGSDARLGKPRRLGSMRASASLGD